jgi:hypothetical protein
MLYQSGEAGRYSMTEGIRRAEQARIARDIARGKGGGKRGRVATMIVAVMTFGLKH